MGAPGGFPPSMGTAMPGLPVSIPGVSNAAPPSLPPMQGGGFQPAQASAQMVQPAPAAAPAGPMSLIDKLKMAKAQRS